MGAAFFLHQNGIVHTRLFLLTARHGSGVLSSEATWKAFEVLKQHVMSFPMVPHVVSCSGVTSITPSSFDRNGGKFDGCDGPVVFYDLEPIRDSLLSGLGSDHKAFSGGRILVHSEGPTEETKVKEWIQAAQAAERAYVADIVKSSFDRHRPDGLRRLVSTPFLSNGVFNFSRILMHPDQFLWVTSLMSELLVRSVEELRLAEYRLLAVSLRASPLAAGIMRALQNTCAGLQVELVDHLGPKQAILEEYSLSRIPSPRDLVFLGDYIIGGTELKIAQTYASTSGRRIRLALAVATLLPHESYHDNIAIRSLTNIADAAPYAVYQVTDEHM